jgi:hypothetical protein
LFCCSEGADVSVTEVINEDDDDVGFALGSKACERRSKRGRDSKSETEWVHGSQSVL